MCVLIHKIVAYKKPGYLRGRVTESRSWWAQSESAQGESKTCPTSDLLECNCSGAYIQCRTSQQRLKAHFKYSFFKQLATMGVILEILSVPVHYLLFVTYNSWRHQLDRLTNEGETFEQSETGSIIISARVGSGPPPENLTDPGAVFFFQKSEVCYLSLCARLCQSSECYNVVVSFITFPTSCTSHYVQNAENGSNTTCVFWDFNEDGLLLIVYLSTGVI